MFGNTEVTVARNPFRACHRRTASTCRAALHSFPRSNATNCSSSAISSGPATTAAGSRRGTCRSPHSATATSARRRHAFTIRRPATRTAPAVSSSPTTRSRPAASAPIARSLINNIPMPNIPGAAVGAINFEKPYVRERRTNQGDVKITYQVAQNDLVSVRVQLAQDRQTEGPGDLRHLRRPQTICWHGHQSDAEHWRHVQQSVVGDTGAGGAFRPHASSQ